MYSNFCPLTNRFDIALHQHSGQYTDTPTRNSTTLWLWNTYERSTRSKLKKKWWKYGARYFFTLDSNTATLYTFWDITSTIMDFLLRWNMWIGGHCTDILNTTTRRGQKTRSVHKFWSPIINFGKGGGGGWKLKGSNNTFAHLGWTKIKEGDFLKTSLNSFLRKNKTQLQTFWEGWTKIKGDEIV